MKDATERQLMRAYELIEAGKLDEARAILEPILLSDKNNPDAWWIYAHAVTDAPSARKALDSVLRLDPQYPGAKELYAQLDEIGKPTAASAPAPSDDNFEPEFLDAPVLPRSADTRTSGGEASSENRRNWVPIAGLVAVLAVIIVIVLLLRPPGPTTTPTETATVSSVVSAVTDTPSTDDSAAQSATEEVVASMDATEVIESGTADLDLIGQSMSSFSLVENSLGIVDTAAGQTLLVQICTTPGAELRATLPSALLSLANASVFSSVTTDFIGVQMVDCANDNAILRTVVSSLIDAQAFANGGIDASTYQTRWQSL